MTVVKELSDYRRTLTEGAFFQRQNPDFSRHCKMHIYMQHEKCTHLNI